MISTWTGCLKVVKGKSKKKKTSVKVACTLAKNGLLILTKTMHPQQGILIY